MILYLTGMHSSGTSLISNYLHHCGVDMMSKASIDSLGEDKKFRIISHRILGDSGIHRYAPSFDPTSLAISKETVRKMKSQIKSTNNGNGFWGWKAPINSLCIWKWLPLLKKSIGNEKRIKILLIFRHPAEVLKSFYRRKSKKDIRYISSQADKEPYHNLESVWFNYNKSVLDFVAQSTGFDFIVIQTRDFIEQPSILTDTLGLQTIPLKGIFNKQKFLPEKRLIFRQQKSKELWSTLISLSVKC